MYGQGNPLCLLKAYPSQVISQLPQLEHFDGRPAVSDASSTLESTMVGSQSQSPTYNDSHLLNVELELTLTDILPAARLVMDTMQSNCAEPSISPGVYP